jgi:hypothetical protein
LCLNASEISKKKHLLRVLQTPDDKLTDREKSEKQELLQPKRSDWNDETDDQHGTLPSAGIDVPSNVHDDGEGAWTEQRHDRHYRPGHTRPATLTYEDRKMLQEDMIHRLSGELKKVLDGSNSVLDGTSSAAKIDMFLKHIEQTVDLLLANKDNAVQFPDVVIWWFLGYDKDARVGYQEQSNLPYFWVNYCQRMKYYNSERNNKYEEYKQKYQKSINDLKTHIANTTDRNTVKLELREITQNYWNNYYLQRNEILDKKTTRRKYPEFEYWFWYMLESMEDREQFYTKEYRLKVYKSDITNKDLALETIDASGKIKSNVEQVLLYFFEHNFKQARNENRTPLALMAVIVFDYSLLDFYLKQIQQGILHDPKNPYTKSRKEREAEKEKADEERRIQNALNASLARMRDADGRRQCAELSFKIHQKELSPEWKRMQNQKKSIYNTFAFQNVHYEFGKVGVKSVTKTVKEQHLSYMQKTMQNTTAGEGIEQTTDLFIYIHEHCKRTLLNVDYDNTLTVYENISYWLKQELQQPGTWLEKDNSFFHTLQSAGYTWGTAEERFNCYREFAHSGLKAKATRDPITRVWSQPREIRGSFFMLDWITKLLKIYVRVVLDKKLGNSETAQAGASAEKAAGGSAEAAPEVAAGAAAGAAVESGAAEEEKQTTMPNNSMFPPVRDQIARADSAPGDKSEGAAEEEGAAGQEGAAGEEGPAGDSAAEKTWANVQVQKQNLDDVAANEAAEASIAELGATEWNRRGKETKQTKHESPNFARHFSIVVWKTH